jgi:hypothetical protein
MPVSGFEIFRGGQGSRIRSTRAMSMKVRAVVLTTRSTRAAGGVVVRQRVQPPEQVTHHGELPGTVGELNAFNEPRHEDRAAIEVRYRIAGRQPFRGVVLPLQEAEDGGVALDTGTRPGGGNTRATHGPPSVRSMRNT